MLTSKDKKDLLYEIKEIVKNYSHTARVGLYIMVVLIWSNTCDIERDQSQTNKKLDKLEQTIDSLRMEIPK